MATVCIIGAGELGGAVADALAQSGRISRVWLVDVAGNVAAGKALDIQQSGAVIGFHTRLDGSDDMTRAAGCAACVIADKAGAGEWQGDDGYAMLTRLARYLGDSPIVFAGPAANILMRATDGDGNVAPEENNPPLPNGATGWPQRSVRVG